MISSYPGISQAIAVLKKNKENKEVSYLVGYYVCRNELDNGEIINYLSYKLPQYMLPREVMHLKSLPLNANGKLDIHKLPDPKFRDLDKYIAPRDDVESKIALIWSEILNIPVADIGIYHDFFTLGGNSILAIKLISILNREFHNLLKVVDIFIYRNISTLKSRILDKRDNKLIVKLNNLDD